MALVTQILGALIALPKIGALINGWIAEITSWYVNMQNEGTKHAIADAAAMAARAETQDDRVAAAKAWRDALSRSRYS